MMTKARAKATTPAPVALQWLHGYASVQVIAAFEGESPHYSYSTHSIRASSRSGRSLDGILCDHKGKLYSVMDYERKKTTKIQKIQLST